MTLSLTEYKKKTQELDFEEITEKTVLTKEDLLTEVQSRKKIGYSKDVEESERGKVCFGAPVFNDEGEYVCSVNICGGVEEVQQEEQT